MTPSDSIFTKSDADSLDNLSKIDKHQVIDIYGNGSISAPYNQGKIASGWRTARWITGYGNNRDDIPKIKNLMERALTCCLRGDKTIERKLENSITGLNNLKSTYEELKRTNTVEELNKIIIYVEQNLKFIKENEGPIKNLNYQISNDRINKLTMLEASCLNTHGAKDALEGARYYIDKISIFILTESQSLTDQEKITLEALKKTLTNSLSMIPKKDLDYYALCFNEAKKLPISDNPTPAEKEKIFKIAANEIERKRAASNLEALDAMNPADQATIGLIIPMDYSWTGDDGTPRGHAFCLSLCKEADGSYTASQINAGGLSIGEVVKTNMHLNFRQLTSISLPPVVEFGPLTREEALNFLQRARNDADRTFMGEKEAEAGYKELFAEFFEKRRPDRIPPRRAQVTGNCAIRSTKEAIAFSLQKSDNAALANKLMRFSDPRVTGSSLPYEDVQPLLMPQG